MNITKFNDLNNNSKRDSGEPGLKGWEFTIEGPNDTRFTNTTDSNGEIHLKLILPGRYVVTETPKLEWIPTTPIEQSATLQRGDKEELKFGNYKPILLNITKFNDRNANGTHDSGEPYLSDWEFTIEGPNDTRFTETTDSNGEIHLRLILPGRYVVTEIPKPGWISTTPIQQSATLNSGDHEELYFGNTNNTLKIVKFEDRNANGIHDSGEPYLSDWEFTIEGPTGTETKYTDPDGKIEYIYTPGDYVITETLKPGWIPTTPIQQSATLNPGDHEELYFGNTNNILKIVKFEDRNANGTHDSGEPYLSDWEFTIEGPNDTRFTETTDSNGEIEYIYTPGDYVITETLKPGWYNITDITWSDSLNRGPVTLYFGNTNNTLEIVKFEDRNANGTRDSGEPGLKDWEFIITDSSTDERIKVYTGNDGVAHYKVKANREYIVSETLRLPWRNTTPLEKKILIDQNLIEVDFGNVLPTRLNITKFNDRNKNGTRDSGEPGLKGWEFNITDPKGEIHKYTTDSQGNITFVCDDFGFGDYKVEEIPQEGWIPTTPLDLKVMMVAGHNESIDFGNSPSCPCNDAQKIYVPPKRPNWTNKDKEMNLSVTKSIHPYILHDDLIDACNGSVINYTLEVCVGKKMKPTDLVLAVDTSGSTVAKDPNLLKDISDSIIKFVQSNKGTPNLRIGLVSWDENIDESVNPTTDYNSVIDAAGNLSANPKEFTRYQVGLDGSLNAFRGSPSDSKKIIVFITDARGHYEPVITYPEMPDYTVHMIVISPTTEINEGRMKNLTRITNPTDGVLKIIDDPAKIETKLEDLVSLECDTQTLSNMRVTDSLPSYLHPIDGSFTEEPVSNQKYGINWNTTTLEWDIGTLSPDDNCWKTSFNVLFCWRIPADASQPEDAPRVTSEVTYTDPDTGDVRSLSIPEGGIWIEPPATTEQAHEEKGLRSIPGFGAPLALFGLSAAGYFLRRKTTSR
ncbi:MAG: SdrD B-like domain-containing protein [Methanotrichaceae archaeon]